MEPRKAAPRCARCAGASIREPVTVGPATEQRLAEGPTGIDCGFAVERGAAAARHDVRGAEPVLARRADTGADVVVDVLRALIDVVVPVEDDVGAVELEERSPLGTHVRVAADRRDPAGARVRRLVQEDELPLAGGGCQVAGEPGTLGGVGGRVGVEHDEVRVAVVEGVVALLLGAVAGQGEHLDLDRARPAGRADAVQVVIAERREEGHALHGVHVVGERVVVPVGLGAVLVGVVADRDDHLRVRRILEVGDGLLVAAGLAPVADDREEQVRRVRWILQRREVRTGRSGILHDDAADLQPVIVTRARQQTAQRHDVAGARGADLAAARLGNGVAEEQGSRVDAVIDGAVAGGVRPPRDGDHARHGVRVLDDRAARDRDGRGPGRHHQCRREQQKDLRSHQALSVLRPEPS